MPVREVPQMMTPSPSNSSQKTEDHSRNSKTIFTSKIFHLTWMTIKSNNFSSHMVWSNLFISRKMLLANSDLYAPTIQTIKIKITVQNVLKKLLMNSTTPNLEKKVLQNFTSDTPWQRAKEKLKRRKTLLDTKHQRKGAIFMSRISQLLGLKMISSNNSHNLDKLKRLDLSLKEKPETHLLLSAIKHQILLHQPNRCCTIKLSMERLLSLTIMRLKNSDKFKKKKPLTKPTSKDISNNKLVGSIWTTWPVTLILPRFFNNLLRSCIKMKQWMLISTKVRETSDHRDHSRDTTTTDTRTRTMVVCKETCNTKDNLIWDKDLKVCQFHHRMPTWEVCLSNQWQLVTCQWPHHNSQVWEVTKCQECHQIQAWVEWTISNRESTWLLSRDITKQPRRLFHLALRETHTWKNK